MADASALSVAGFTKRRWRSSFVNSAARGWDQDAPSLKQPLAPRFLRTAAPLVLLAGRFSISGQRIRDGKRLQPHDLGRAEDRLNDRQQLMMKQISIVDLYRKMGTIRLFQRAQRPKCRFPFAAWVPVCSSHRVGYILDQLDRRNRYRFNHNAGLFAEIMEIEGCLCDRRVEAHRERHAWQDIGPTAVTHDVWSRLGCEMPCRDGDGPADLANAPRLMKHFLHEQGAK